MDEKEIEPDLNTTSFESDFALDTEGCPIYFQNGKWVRMTNTPLKNWAVAKGFPRKPDILDADIIE